MKKVGLFKTVALALLASAVTSQSLAQSTQENKPVKPNKPLSAETKKIIEDDMLHFEKMAFKQKGTGIHAEFKSFERAPSALPSTGDSDYKAIYQFSTPQEDGTEVQTTIGFVFEDSGFGNELQSNDAKGAIVMMQNKKDHSYIYMKVYFEDWEKDGKDLNRENVHGREGFAYYPDLQRNFKNNNGDSTKYVPNKSYPYMAVSREISSTKAILFNDIKKMSEHYNQAFNEFTEWQNKPYKKKFDPNNHDAILAWNMF